MCHRVPPNAPRASRPRRAGETLTRRPMLATSVEDAVEVARGPPRTEPPVLRL